MAESARVISSALSLGLGVPFSPSPAPRPAPLLFTYGLPITSWGKLDISTGRERDAGVVGGRGGLERDASTEPSED